MEDVLTKVEEAKDNLETEDKENEEEKIKSDIKYIEKKEKKTLSYSKMLVCFILICSEIQIFLSYWLAYRGAINIAESLSANVVTTCLGTFGMYAFKATIENLNKYGIRIFELRKIIDKREDDGSVIEGELDDKDTSFRADDFSNEPQPPTIF